jgi:hypothetical protein
MHTFRDKFSIFICLTSVRGHCLAFFFLNLHFIQIHIPFIESLFFTTNQGTFYNIMRKWKIH